MYLILKYNKQEISRTVTFQTKVTDYHVEYVFRLNKFLISVKRIDSNFKIKGLIENK